MQINSDTSGFQEKILKKCFSLNIHFLCKFNDICFQKVLFMTVNKKPLSLIMLFATS